MIISFSTKALRTLSERERHAAKVLGETTAVALHARLADLLAARDPTELPLGYKTLEEFPKRFAVSLVHGVHAVFESNHLRDSELPAHKAVKWQGVTRIKMLEIVKSDE